MFMNTLNLVEQFLSVGTLMYFWKTNTYDQRNKPEKKKEKKERKIGFNSRVFFGFFLKV